MKTPESIIIALAKKKFTSHTDFYSALHKLFTARNEQPVSKATLISEYRQLVAKGKIKQSLGLEKMLIKGAVRTLSGVTVITVLTKPWACPGKCVFCPTEPNMPKSYLSNEPAAQRAVRLHFNPFAQVQKRIEALETNGHEVDKIEVIVLGGTWSSYPKPYQTWFVRQVFYAANMYKQKRRRSRSIAEEQKINETARYRIIGLTLETRSDHVTPTEVRRLRELGCTRVQLGIQHVENAILDLNRRGEHIEDDIAATELLKRAGFKVDHHYMPDLPGSTPEKDVAMFKRVFYGTDLQPDQIKIYPCVVNEYAQLYHWFKSGKYKPYGFNKLVRVLKKIKKMTPPYVRINRLVRDIPEESIIAGNDVTNLRQYLQRELIKTGTPCKCIRCREVRDDARDAPRAVLKKRTYRASNGTEHFLSFESKNESKIFALLRLRFNDSPQRAGTHAPAEKHFIHELTGAALVRELHVYGLMIPVSKLRSKKSNKAQHLGFGKRLMAEAERLAREAGFKKIAVISGIGVRDYYRKLGYRLEGTYMVKNIV